MVHPDSKIVVTGAGTADLDTEGDPREHLRTPKMRKLLGVWDRLAILAAKEAIDDAGLSAPEGERTHLGEAAGLFVTVGHVPLQESVLDGLLEGSLDDNGDFSGPLHAKSGYLNFNPLWTFRSLTNSPAFFVSACFDLQGPYLVTFSEPGQFYLAMEEALLALREGRCSIAVVGATADQDNEMVQFHFRRTRPPVPEEQLRSGAGFLVLETEEGAAARGAAVRAELCDFGLDYHNHDPLEQSFPQEEVFEPAGPCSDAYWGPASLPISVAKAAAGTLTHTLRSRDGIHGRSTWEVKQ